MTETKFTTSFIPKKPAQRVSSGGNIKKKRSTNLIALISFAIFFIVIIMAVGTFFYKVKLDNDIEKQKQQLALASESLDQQLILEASRLDTRLNLVQKLLDEHLSPSQLFVLLEEFTIGNLRFSDLNFSIGSDGNLNLSGNGSGLGYESIIQQSDAYGQSELLRDVIFSNLQGNEQDIVNFSFQSVIEPRLVNYRETLSASTPDFINDMQQDSENNIMSDLNDDDNTDIQQENLNNEDLINQQQ